MMKHEILIDGSNFFETIRQLNLDVDYALLRNYLTGNQKATRINYFTAVFEDDQQHRALQPLIDWLSYNGYNVISKPAKSNINAQGQEHIKGNMDVEIAVYGMQAAEYCDAITLFTGDGDFVSLVEAMQRKGVFVTVVSSTKTEPQPIVASDLRRQADNFVDIIDIKWHITKKPAIEKDDA